MLPKHYNWFFFPLTILLTLTLLIPTSAHSGRTDSKGGHHNTFTGTYHYHHGKPAHDHYDMDGDGDLDCPYQYQDSTTGRSTSDTNGFVKWLKRQSIPELIISFVLIIPALIYIFNPVISFLTKVFSRTKKK